MTAYIIHVGEGDAIEATEIIYKLKVDGILEELQALARGKTGGWKMVLSETKGKTPYSSVELTKKLLTQGLKEDTVHLAYGPKNKTHFWVNINSVEIS